MCMNGQGKTTEKEGATSKRPVFVLRGIFHFFYAKRVVRSTIFKTSSDVIVLHLTGLTTNIKQSISIEQPLISF